MDTYNCPCTYGDTADGTIFKYDIRGMAVKVECYYPGRGMVAKAEWHPYDEILYVYDTENDGDTIYVSLRNFTTGVTYGPYQAPGTSAEYEYTRVPFSFDEEDYIYLEFYDGAGSTDYLGAAGPGQA